MQPTRLTGPRQPDEMTALVAEILGDLAFMANTDEPCRFTPGARWFAGRISYRGPATGTLHCWCTRAFAVQLAANLLGVEPEDDDAFHDARDAVCEFMNVLCGHFVTQRHGTSAVFNLSIPEAAEAAAPTPPAPDLPDHCALSIGGEPFLCIHETS